jgi:hypothetical protein
MLSLPGVSGLRVKDPLNALHCSSSGEENERGIRARRGEVSGPAETQEAFRLAEQLLETLVGWSLIPRRCDAGY